MGKKRIITKGGEGGEVVGPRSTPSPRSVKKHLERGILHITATYNNTILTLADLSGQVVASSSAGALGFTGAKKGTPFAAAKVGEAMAVKAQALGLREVSIVVSGVGAGRESGMRSFAMKGVAILGIRDATPIPFNGPRPKKPRRV